MSGLFGSALSGYPAPPVNKLLPPPTVTWTGISGAQYQTQLHPIGSMLWPVPGIYIACKLAPNGLWDAVYIGETEDLNDRIGGHALGHHKRASMAAHGATHICTMIVRGGHAERLRVETDLRHACSPPCNDQ